MLKILERSITLQLLVFYSLFLLPLLLGGIELYFFQRDTWQTNSRQADVGLAQAIAFDVAGNIRAVSEEGSELATSQAARQRDLAQLSITFTQANRSHPGERAYLVCNPSGKVILTYPANQKQLGEDLSGSDTFQQAIKGDGAMISVDQNGALSSSRAISVATLISNNNHAIGIIIINLSLARLTAQFRSIQQQFSASDGVSIWLADTDGQLLAGTDQRHKTLPDLAQSIKDFSSSLVAHQQDQNWSYSLASIEGTPWKVVVARPVDLILAPVISFQHSLVIALVILALGASLFWFAMHGWVVAPLSRLARAVRMIKPNQTEMKVSESKLIAKERTRIDEIGQLIAAFSLMEDQIHDLFRKTDETSQARLHTLDAIMQSMDEGVLLESPQGQVVYANRSFTQFVGLSWQDVPQAPSDENHLEEKLLALIENPTAYRAALQQTEQTSGPQVVTFQVRSYYNRVGQLVPVRRDIRMQHFAVRDQSGQLIGRGKIFNDVTIQNEAEHMKKNLLAIVSHELRTPLTAIKGYATSLLEPDIEADPTIHNRFLGRIVEEGDRMADLVTNLLEMSQLEAGTLKLNPALHHLHALLEPIVNTSGGQRISIEAPADVPLLYIDRRRLEMVLRNVIENARRYGGPDAQIAIAVRYKQDEELHLSITDNGPGLLPHLTERIFDHFYQIDGSRERSSGGVGLGLAICRGFVEAHGGRIWAENRTDGLTGAVFHIWLPARVLGSNASQPGMFQLRNAL